MGGEGKEYLFIIYLIHVHLCTYLSCKTNNWMISQLLCIYTRVCVYDPN